MVRNPGRLLAPIAIAAVAVGAYAIVQSNVGGHPASRIHAAPRRAAGRPGHTSTVRRRTRPSFYTVRSGDTLSAIAGRTGVPLATLEALNSTLAPSYSLHTGQRLRLRR